MCIDGEKTISISKRSRLCRLTVCRLLKEKRSRSGLQVVRPKLKALHAGKQTQVKATGKNIRATHRQYTTTSKSFGVVGQTS